MPMRLKTEAEPELAAVLGNAKGKTFRRDPGMQGGDVPSARRGTRVSLRRHADGVGTSEILERQSR